MGQTQYRYRYAFTHRQHRPPPALGQTSTPVTGVVLTNSSAPINNPFLWLQDSASDAGVLPLFEVSGGQGSSTLGIEITSTTNSTGSTPPSLSTIMPAGFGGLSLVQTGGSTSMSGGQSSPVLAMCANQYGTGGTGGQGPDCWSWQVLGGSAGNDMPDILQLLRTTTTNKTNNITVLFPASINLATAPFLTAGTPTSAGQITVGPQPYSGTNANVPATFTGASTTSTSMNAVAGPAIVQPGQLTASSPDATSTEGMLQLMQSYKGTNSGGSNYGLLACPDKTNAQGVVVCGTSNATAQVVGVYNSNPQQAGATITPIRYGRAPLKNFGSSATWTNGDYVCQDTTNNGYSVDNGTTPCATGQAVGIAVGDVNGSTNSHPVDLTTAAVVQGGALMTFFCNGTVTGGSSPNYMFPGAQNTGCGQIATTNYIQPVSFSGTIKNLEVFYGVAPGSGHTDHFTVVTCHLGTCTPSTVTCPISGTGTSCSDTTDSVSVSQGDGVQITDLAQSGSTAHDARITIEIQ